MLFVDTILQPCQVLLRHFCRSKTVILVFRCAVISATSHLGDKPSRRQSSRRQTNSATTNSATGVGQLGDNLFPAFHYLFLGYKINGHIYFGTSVVQRYHKFCDPIHSSPYMVPQHTCPMVRLNPQNTVSVS